jgi:small-conductance mechanosensitive channel
VHLFGIDWVGVNAENGRKLLLSVIFVGVVLLLSAILRALVGLVLGRRDQGSIQTRFWTRQGVSLVTAIVLILGLLSIWFNDPTRLTTAFGLVSAGLAFALQQVVTAVAGYFVILRGSTFTVGDRISMGGVRGDVLRLGFIQTTIMEMGQPPSVQSADPAMWVKSRQFTGRIVTVSNSRIFSEPVFNYTRDFPFIWGAAPSMNRASRAGSAAPSWLRPACGN